MAKTTTELFRSVMGRGEGFAIEIGILPSEDILDPRWEDTQYFNEKKKIWITSKADVKFVDGEVQTGGGTSLHDKPKWFSAPDFWIPEGTEYSEEIHIKKDDDLRKSPRNPKLTGYHYQLEPRTAMTMETFKGYLSNMARAAVARQCALARKEPAETKT
jgi:hypothetical protein